MTTTRCLSLLCLLSLTAACSNDGLDSKEEARRAYYGLDKSIGKSLTLGFAGFNSASSANIDPQATTGDAAGTLTITGQVDQGAADNKGMRLYVGMVGYDDGDIVLQDESGKDITVHIIYDTTVEVTTQPYLALSLRNIPADATQPDGTFTGSLMGDYSLHGDIDGVVTLNLTFAGTITFVTGTGVERVSGTTTVLGTARSGDGTYDVSLSI